ncbi:ABC transporter ATP-binding protein [Sterolibacterium denitrificans]|nr:ABC transporter ATP-binding protein [Sterolibacterium denitrificans]KYC29008.1 ABC transporter ATP-binding protein [Sterolibacterium denitrificans]
MLEVRGLEVHYGGIAAVQGIDLTVAAGETVALIGANGAGKSSTLKAIARILHDGTTQGRVRLCGEDLATLPTHRLIARGLALVPEGRGIFTRLSVAENLLMGAYARQRRGSKPAIRADLERIYGLLPRLAERERQLAGTLSGGEQQMLALGRALMGQPRLLLLDEPSMGLAPLMVQKIFEVIRNVAASGVSILLVEQNARLALETASRGYVMESGRVSLSGDAASLLADPRVRAAYLGE